jgi:signal transduction histidine kinase
MHTGLKLKLVFAFFLCLTLLAFGAVSCSSKATVSLEESNQRVAKASTHVAAVGLGDLLQDITEETQRKETVRTFIDPIRFLDDQSGYFYVYYYNCVNLAHAIDKSLQDQDLTDYLDMHGDYVIRELSESAKEGGGFETFYWPHPETKKEQRKIGYVEPIPGTDYFIGTGFYPDAQ